MWHHERWALPVSRLAPVSQRSGRRHVLVAMEEVGRIDPPLDRGKPLPGRPGIRLADTNLALVPEEVRVRAAPVAIDGGTEAVEPGLLDASILLAFVERGQTDEDAAVAMGEGGRIGGHARHGTTERAQLRHADRGVDVSEEAQDR